MILSGFFRWASAPIRSISLSAFCCSTMLSSSLVGAEAPRLLSSSLPTFSSSLAGVEAPRLLSWSLPTTSSSLEDSYGSSSASQVLRELSQVLREQYLKIYVIFHQSYKHTILGGYHWSGSSSFVIWLGYLRHFLQMSHWIKLKSSISGSALLENCKLDSFF